MKRSSADISIPSCLAGQAPERHFKRQMTDKSFGVASNLEDDPHVRTLYTEVAIELILSRELKCD